MVERPIIASFEAFALYFQGLDNALLDAPVGEEIRFALSSEADLFHLRNVQSYTQFLLLVHILCSVLLFCASATSQLNALEPVFFCTALDVSSVIFVLSGYATAKLWFAASELSFNLIANVMLQPWLDMQVAMVLCLTVGAYHAHVNGELTAEQIVLTLFEGTTGLRFFETQQVSAWHTLNPGSWLPMCMFWCFLSLPGTCKLIMKIEAHFGSSGMKVMLACNCAVFLLFAIFTYNNRLFYTSMSNIPYRMCEFNTGVALSRVLPVLCCINSQSALHLRRALTFALLCAWMAQISSFGEEPCSRLYHFQDCVAPYRPTILTTVALLAIVFLKPNDSQDISTCVEARPGKFSVDDVKCTDSTSVASDGAIEVGEADSSELLNFNQNRLPVINVPSFGLMWSATLFMWPVFCAVTLILNQTFSLGAINRHKVVVVYTLCVVLYILTVCYHRVVRPHLRAITASFFNRMFQQSQFLSFQLHSPELFLFLAHSCNPQDEA